MKQIFLITLVLSTKLAFGNDGSFYGSGNHLTPINETDISVKREILTLKKVRNEIMEVTVYYEFFNPGKEKNITVGFEAFSPSGDVDATPKKGEHPYMTDFTVQLNNEFLKYNIAYVGDSAYVKAGIIKSRSLNELNVDNVNAEDFFYVYHFKARFQSGLNILKHTYTYKLSSSIVNNYDFEYVLTAAKRWGNKQIDDFTLILDMGDFETFCLSKNFFKSSNEWLVNGIGKFDDFIPASDYINDKGAVKFHIRKGTLVFHKNNFKPAGELFLYSKSYYDTEGFSYLPFSYYQETIIKEPVTDIQKRILKNLPFARRGYIFQNAELNSFYKQLDWYSPNPAYVPDIDQLDEREKKWIERWK
jgi:hypothetical protein